MNERAQEPDVWADGDDDARFRPLHELAVIVADAAQHRELLMELTRRDLRIRYKQAVMGVLWAIVTPLVVVLAGALVRYAFARNSGHAVAQAELAGLALKSLGWSFVAGALGFSTQSLTANLALVTKVYFPREILPVSAVLTQIVDSSVGMVVLSILLPLAGIGSVSGVAWGVLLAVLIVCLTVGVSLLASCANVFFRDARYLVQLVTSFGIFFTPVFYDVDAFGPRGVRVLMANPLTPLLEGARLAVVYGHDLRVPLVGANGTTVWSPWYLVYAAGCALLGLAASALVFRRAEAVFAEYV
ncbi:MAG: ABC transporter permease [bacterium]